MTSQGKWRQRSGVQDKSCVFSITRCSYKELIFLVKKTDKPWGFGSGKPWIQSGPCVGCVMCEMVRISGIPQSSLD